jgi:iron complex transport system ATP-binding protein
VSLDVKDVSWAAGGRMIVDGVSLDIAPGRMLGLIGPNGSGKSSLLRLIGRLRRVKGGVVMLDGADMAEMPRTAIARRMALVEQQAGTEADLTVLDVVRLGRTPHRGPFAGWSAADEAAVQEALAEVDMADAHDRQWRSLSGGERQRVHIARALAQSPRELLLDEPTNHLDIRHQLDILALVRRLPVTAVVALHDLNLTAMFCDAVAVMQAGRLIAAGPPEAVLTPDLIAAVFGVRAYVERSPHHGCWQVHYLPDQPEGGLSSKTSR